jgi:hypothetical protein
VHLSTSARSPSIPKQFSAMNAIVDLTHALAEWRRLTDLEKEAILSDNWHGVLEPQSRKAQLQAEIHRMLASAGGTPFTQEHVAGDLEGRFNSAVSELMALEKRNGDLLAAKHKRRQAEAESLALTQLSLQGVRRAYGSSRGPHWESYS